MKLSKNKTLSFVLNAILDLLFLFVLIFSIICAITTLSTHTNILGVRLGIIQSKSMEASELYIGDVVTINKKEEYQIGDIIAFYRDVANYGKNIDDLDMSNKAIWIHEIIDIKVDEFGNYSYLTKGTSNPNDDTFYVPYDFVLGVGKPLNPVLNDIISFVVSRIGIICLIIIPCIIMLIYLSWELVMLLTEEPEEKRKHVVISNYNRMNKAYISNIKPVNLYLRLQTKDGKPIKIINNGNKKVNIILKINTNRRGSDDNA